MHDLGLQKAVVIHMTQPRFKGGNRYAHKGRRRSA